MSMDDVARHAGVSKATIYTTSAALWKFVGGYFQAPGSAR
jgi:hypothetical protein